MVVLTVAQVAQAKAIQIANTVGASSPSMEGILTEAARIGLDSLSRTREIETILSEDADA
jgi:hypothetical protein